MQRSLIFGAIAAALAIAGVLFVLRSPPQTNGAKTGGETSAGAAGAGAGATVTGGDATSNNPAAPQEQVLPVEKARAASPIWDRVASWPKPDALPAYPEKPGKDLDVAAVEVERDVEQWFSKDLKFTRGVDGAQVYLKGKNASGSVTVLVARNRIPDVYTLSFEAVFADAVSVDPETTVKRLKVVLGPELFAEVEKRGVKPSPAVTGSEDMAGLVTLGNSGPGTVFPFLYVYAKPKQVVGILQTIAMKKVK